jgi:ribosomal protein S18 acetylase RimI-like enzyme
MIVRAATRDDAAAIAHVHIETWRTAYRGIVPDDILAGLSYERRLQRWTEILGRPADRRSGNFVAAADDRVVGFVSGGPERDGDPLYKGELYAIYVLMAYERRGLGRLLTHAVAAMLVEAGFDSMLVWVLSDNIAARRFYEALGGTALREKPADIFGLTLPEVSYGWTDLDELVRKTGV